MKTLKYLAFGLAAAFVATGCSQDNNEPQITEKRGTPAEFIMTIGSGLTRTETVHDGDNRTTSWKTGDEVGIFATSSDGTQNNCKYVYDGTEWKAADISSAIALESGKDYSFYAYYPYTENITASAASLNVLSDQSATQGEGNSNYDLSDVLMSKANADTYSGEPIALNYRHAYAMVEVLVAGDKVGDTAPQKVVLKDVITDANIDLVTQTVTNTANKQDVVMAYVADGDNAGTYLYRAIVPEQTIAQGSTLLEVYGVNGGKNYVFKAPNKDVTYPQGKYFRMEVTIGENNVGIKFPTGSIDPWTPSEGIDLSGEELKENLITVSVSSLTPETFQQLTSTNYDQTESFWYVLAHKDDATSTGIEASVITDNGESVISFKTTTAATYSWYKSGVGYHWQSESNFTPGFYKLSYKIKSPDNTLTLRGTIRGKGTLSNVADKDLFFANSLHKITYLDYKTTQTENYEEAVFYMDLRWAGSTAGTCTPEEIDMTNTNNANLYQNMEVKFKHHANSTGTIYLKDVKLEAISLEEIPENQRPTE